MTRRDGGAKRRQSQKRTRRSRSKGQSQSSARTAVDFWGDADRLPPVDDVTVSTDPSALIRSLGRPPLTGSETVSEHYFRAVYESAAVMAQVLATAGDLLPDDEA